MDIPKHFLDFDRINSIDVKGRILYRLEDTMGPDQAGVKSGVSSQSSNYHRSKVLQTYGDFEVVRISKPRQNEAGIIAHHYYDASEDKPKAAAVKFAPPGTYVQESLLYRLLPLSVLEKNLKLIEKFETEVFPALFKSGWFICDDLNAEQLAQLKAKVESMQPKSEN